MRSRFSEKNRKRYGTVNGDLLKRDAPEEKLRYGQGDQFGRTTVYNIVILLVKSEKLMTFGSVRFALFVKSLKTIGFTV